MFKALFFRARHFAAHYFGLRGPAPELHPLPPIMRTAVFGARADVAAARSSMVALAAQRAPLAITQSAARD